MIELHSIYPIQDNTLRFLYELLQQREARVSISHKAMPRWDDHVDFVCRMPYRHWWLITGRHDPVPKGPYHTARIGAAYLSKQNEIGIHILKEHQHRGFGQATVKKIMGLFPGERFLANVAPSNERSQRMFEGLGFNLIQYTYEI